MSENHQISPVAQSDRLTILDSLRGFAILGILLMNIIGFGLPGVSGYDPSVQNEPGTLNFSVWFFINSVMDGSQRALFSMLFGAGLLLFIGRKENKITEVSAADYFFRRQVWLVVFSLFDVFVLLWNGDILFDYAVYGMFLYIFRNLSPRKLLVAAAVCFVFIVAQENRDFYAQKKMIVTGEDIAAMDTTINKLTLLQKESLNSMLDARENSSPERKRKRSELAYTQVRNNYPSVYTYRTNHYIENISRYTYFECWDVFLFMFVGMAFLKMGILTGNASSGTYWIMTVLGLSAGIAISYFQVQRYVDFQYNGYEYARNAEFMVGQVGRTFRSFGIFGMIMLLFKSGWFGWLFALVRPAGQMALTNYLVQSIICGFLFNAYGLKLAGQLQRYELYFVVAVIWAFQIIFCHLWMRFFRFGPFEWAWRSLTYWKKQPFVR